MQDMSPERRQIDCKTALAGLRKRCRAVVTYLAVEIKPLCRANEHVAVDDWIKDVNGELEAMQHGIARLWGDG